MPHTTLINCHNYITFNDRILATVGYPRYQKVTVGDMESTHM